MTDTRPLLSLCLLLACDGDGAPKGTPAGQDSAGGEGDGADGADGAGDPDPDCVTDAEFFTAQATPLFSDCLTCHVEGGMAAGTRMVLAPAGEADAEATNWDRLQAFVTTHEDAAGLLTLKPTGQVSHAGGERFDTLDPEMAVMTELVGRLQAPGGCASPVALPVTCDGTVRPGTAPLRLLTDTQYQKVVLNLLGVSLPDGLYPKSERGEGFRTWATSNSVSGSGAESIELAAEAAAAALTYPSALACSEGEAEADCARRFLLDRGARGFRRPLSEAEAALLTRFLDAGLEPETAVRMGVEVLLQSPQLLYIDPRAAEASLATEPVAIDPDTLAARLSFFMTDDLPDEALRAAAASGALSTPEGVSAEAARLVNGAAMTGVVARFHQDWLHLDALHTATKDSTRYPAFDDALVASLKTETDLFTTEVVWLGDGTYDALFSSGSTWVNSDLAPLYGLPDPGAEWSRVELDPTLRPGLLTRAGWLSAHAYSSASAPVRRGAFVLEQLLCESLDPPPGVSTTLPETDTEIVTVRDQLEAHWTDEACSGCHLRIDPVGFAFEHYGALGEWRDTWEDGIPIDATGTFDDPAGEFDGAAELLALLADSDRARACYAQRWFEYAVGRAAEAEDACTLRDLSSRFQASGGDLRGLMVDITLTDAFRARAPHEVTP